jgi:hypothetical protein
MQVDGDDGTNVCNQERDGRRDRQRQPLPHIQVLRLVDDRQTIRARRHLASGQCAALVDGVAVFTYHEVVVDLHRVFRVLAWRTRPWAMRHGQAVYREWAIAVAPGWCFGKSTKNAQYWNGRTRTDCLSNEVISL